MAQVTRCTNDQLTLKPKQSTKCDNQIYDDHSGNLYIAAGLWLPFRKTVIVSNCNLMGGCVKAKKMAPIESTILSTLWFIKIRFGDVPPPVQLEYNDNH